MQSAAIAGQFAIRSDHSMARDDDRNRIGTVGETDRPAGIRISHAASQLPVRNSVSVRNPAKLSPDLLLKHCAFGRELDGEDLELSSKIQTELARCFR